MNYVEREDLLWLYLAHGMQITDFTPEINLLDCSASKFILLSSIRQFKKIKKISIISGIAKRGDLMGMQQLNVCNLLIRKPAIMHAAIIGRQLETVKWLISIKFPWQDSMSVARIHGGVAIVKLLMDSGLKLDNNYCVAVNQAEYREFLKLGLTDVQFNDNIWGNDNYLTELAYCRMGIHSASRGALEYKRGPLFKVIQECYPSVSYLLYSASFLNNLKAVKILWHDGIFVERHLLSRNFAKFGNIRALNFLHKRVAIDSEIFTKAARRGHQNVIEWALQKGMAICAPDDMLKSACRHSLRMAKYCYDLVGQQDIYEYELDGDLPIIKWLVEMKILGKHDMAVHATQHGQLHVLMWMHSQEKFHADSLMRLGHIAKNYGHEHAADWLLRNCL